MTMRMKQVRICGALVVAAGLCAGAMLLGTTMAARAHSYGFCDTVGGCRPNDLTPSACWNDSGSNTPEMGDVWTWYNGNTDATWGWSVPCPSGDVNMRGNDNLTGNAALGITSCAKFNGGGLCVNGTITFNPGSCPSNCATAGGCTGTSVCNNAGATANWRRVVWCHEYGHVMGLGHDEFFGTCMNTAVGSGSSQVLDSHDISHVNRQRQ